VILAPGKAANAGGVAISGLEISQNVLRCSREREEIDDNLRSIMEDIHNVCADAAGDSDAVNDYARGADVAAFSKVASAMVARGI
jgi:glutamate dehydrogenase (NADP+)